MGNLCSCCRNCNSGYNAVSTILLLIWVSSFLFDKLAEIACFSLFHFHRIFRSLTGKTVGDLIRRIRMEYAYHLLRDQQQTVTTTTFETGYENVESFSRAFKKHFGDNASVVKKLPAQFEQKNSYTISLAKNSSSSFLFIDFFKSLKIANLVKHLL